MGAFVFLVVIAFIWLIVASANSGGYQSVVKNGVPGKGILLAVAATPSGTLGVGLNKVERRSVTIDIEVAGKPPYEVQAVVLVPLNLVRDVLPGATVEVRVAKQTIAIVGPGVGFNNGLLLTQGNNQ
ncbi:MAG TPA: hypothetical protein VGM39_15015 [Kofleriaceae bacterium]